MTRANVRTATSSSVVAVCLAFASMLLAVAGLPPAAGAVMVQAEAQVQAAPPAPPAAPTTPSTRREPTAAFRDSLQTEIRRYSRMIDALRDSITAIERAEDPRRERLIEVEEAIAALSQSLGSLTDQLADMQFEVQEGRFSVRDGHGGEVSLELPPDLPDRLREGLSSLTRVILEEMPDTLHIGDEEAGFTWSWSGDGIQIQPVAPPAPQRPRRTIEGGLVKFKEDLTVAADELVLGDVVAIMGDAEIAGHIQGDLVVVLGDLSLTETAEVDGEVYTVLGGLDRADAARVGSLTVVDPGVTLLPGSLGLDTGSWLEFLGWQAGFVLLLLLVLLLLAITPRPRLLLVLETLERRPAESTGLGLLLALFGHLVVLGLAAILVLTVIGIPVALLLVLAVALFDLLAVGVAGTAVGRRLCVRLRLGCGHPWREAALGMLVLHLPAFLAGLAAALGAPLLLVLPLVWLGRLVKFLAFCAGLGAVALGRFGAGANDAPVAPLGVAPGQHGA